MNRSKEDTKQPVPRLAQEVKNMNGKSGKKLAKCIDTLCEILDENDKLEKPVEAKDSAE